jgi:hypothetical protein
VHESSDTPPEVVRTVPGHDLDVSVDRPTSAPLSAVVS